MSYCWLFHCSFLSLFLSFWSKIHNIKWMLPSSFHIRRCLYQGTRSATIPFYTLVIKYAFMFVHCCVPYHTHTFVRCKNVVHFLYHRFLLLLYVAQCCVIKMLAVEIRLMHCLRMNISDGGYCITTLTQLLPLFFLSV